MSAWVKLVTGAPGRDEHEVAVADAADGEHERAGGVVDVGRAQVAVADA